jgi:hypothetical protein
VTRKRIKKQAYLMVWRIEAGMLRGPMAFMDGAMGGAAPPALSARSNRRPTVPLIHRTAPWQPASRVATGLEQPYRYGPRLHPNCEVAEPGWHAHHSTNSQLLQTSRHRHYPFNNRMTTRSPSRVEVPN